MATTNIDLTKTQVIQGVEILRAVYETVREAGIEGAPCSSIYMALQDKLNISLETYTKMENMLIEANLVRKANHCLYDAKR